MPTDYMDMFDAIKYYNYSMVPLKWTAKEREREMDESISNVYDKTKDAILVDKYFGDDMPCDDSFLNELFIKGNKAEILTECKRREKEQD